VTPIASTAPSAPVEDAASNTITDAHAAICLKGAPRKVTGRVRRIADGLFRNLGPADVSETARQCTRLLSIKKRLRAGSMPRLRNQFLSFGSYWRRDHDFDFAGIEDDRSAHVHDHPLWRQGCDRMRGHGRVHIRLQPARSGTCGGRSTRSIGSTTRTPLIDVGSLCRRQ